MARRLQGQDRAPSTSPGGTRPGGQSAKCDDVAFALGRTGLHLEDQAKAYYPTPPRSEEQPDGSLWLSKVRRLLAGCGFYEAHGYAPDAL